MLTALVVLVLVAVLAAIWGMTTYNRFIKLTQKIGEAWSGIMVQLKRRHDVVPNLARLVQSYASHEKELLEGLAQARSPVSEAPSGDLARSEGEFSRAIGRLFAVAENYPDLKASKNYSDLHASLTKIEEEIQMSRRYYNGVTRDYNTLVSSIPSLIVAKACSFREKPFFELDSPGEAANPQIFT